MMLSHNCSCFVVLFGHLNVVNTFLILFMQMLFVASKTQLGDHGRSNSELHRILELGISGGLA